MGGQGTVLGERRGGPQHCPTQTGPCPTETTLWGVRVGPADRSALLARCFSVNFYGMQKEFFVLFCFFVKLKKNLHLILELPYLKKKKEKKTKKKNKKKLGRS